MRDMTESGPSGKAETLRALGVVGVGAGRDDEAAHRSPGEAAVQSPQPAKARQRRPRLRRKCLPVVLVLAIAIAIAIAVAVAPPSLSSARAIRRRTLAHSPAPSLFRRVRPAPRSSLPSTPSAFPPARRGA